MTHWRNRATGPAAATALSLAAVEPGLYEAAASAEHEVACHMAIPGSGHSRAVPGAPVLAETAA